MLSFDRLRTANVRRCVEVFHPLDAWSPTDWATAFAGEAGETCNAVKKLRRLQSGGNTAKDPQSEAACVEAIAAELADTVIYADLLAAREQLDQLLDSWGDALLRGPWPVPPGYVPPKPEGSKG